mgnify:CR=1 FL=1
MDIINQIWPNWSTVAEIGAGAFGKVYKVKREDIGNVSYSAVKVMHIPKDNSEINDLHHSGMDFQSIHSYFEDMVKNLLNEIQIMESLKSATNVVAIEDYQVVAHKDVIGWDIYIRMELVQDLGSFISERGMTRQQVLRMGMDICQALIACERENVIHRDIKIDNVFFNGFDSFKLGDFGISKQLEKTQSALSQKGTNMYMAPEVFRAEKYDHTVDIYSLGILLYRLLNRGRFPFQPPAEQQLYFYDTQRAMEKRLSGDPMTAPVMADEQLTAIILKACAYQAKDRYQSAREMLADLRQYQQSAQYEGGEKVITSEARPRPDLSGNVSVQKNSTVGAFHDKPSDHVETSKKQTGKLVPPVGNDIGVSQKEEKPSKGKKARFGKKSVMIAGIVLLVVILGAAGFMTVRYLTRDTSGLAKKYTTVDKLQISARMPKGWNAKEKEDLAYAYYKKDGVYKEISYTMDFQEAAVTELGTYCGLGAAKGKDAEEKEKYGIAPDGASDEYAQTYLARVILVNQLQGEDFNKKLKESAVYEINGRNYYYIQYDAGKNDDGKNVQIAMYTTVQDGAEITYKLLVQDSEITQEDRGLFDAVMNSVKMDTHGIQYCDLKEADYIEDIYALADKQTQVGSAGVKVNMPVACDVKEEDDGLSGVYDDENSYGEYAYKVNVTSQEKSWIGSLSSGMNDEVAEKILEEEKNQGKTINLKEHVLVGSHACYAVGASDDTGRSFTYYTVYQRKLLSFNYKCKDQDLAISGKAKKMLRSMIDTATYDQ